MREFEFLEMLFPVEMTNEFGELGLVVFSASAN